MARMISAVGVAVGHLAFSLPAAADVAAWCAVINYGEYWDCQYRSGRVPTERAGKTWLVQSEPVLYQFSDGVSAPQEKSQSRTVGLQIRHVRFRGKADMSIALRNVRF
jgi:hypothetical protein